MITGELLIGQVILGEGGRVLFYHGHCNQTAQEFGLDREIRISSPEVFFFLKPLKFMATLSLGYMCSVFFCF